MQRLLTLKQSLQALEDLDFALSNDDEDEDEDGEFMGTSLDDILADGEKLWKFNAALGLEPNELDDLLNDAELPVKLPESEEHRPKKKRKVIADNKKKSTSKLKAPVFDLTEPEFVSSKSSTRLNALEDPLDVYGDATTLTTFDAVDKNVRKKSLRFHTAKIESASSRRKGARMQSMGGDDDIPYRERKKNKDAKLVKEAVKRAEQERGADLNDEEVKSTAGKKRARGDDEGDESLESPDDYYELVQKQSKSEKMKKKVEYEEAHGLSRYACFVAFTTTFSNSFFLPVCLWKNPQALARLRALSSKTKVSLPGDQKLCAILASRKDRGSKRRRRKLPRRKRCTREDWLRQKADTTVRGQVFLRSSKVSA